MNVKPKNMKRYMKNKVLLGALLMSIASIFTACKDDNGSNPHLIVPQEFTLNTPAYANETVDLQKTEDIALSWSQPKYTADNAPLQVTYEIQVSPDNKFTVSVDEASADKSGATVADYAAVARTTTQCTYSLLTKDLDKALVQIKKWKESEVPAELTAFVRVHSFILENGKRLNSVYSNAVELSFNPYYIELKDAEPIMWYLVGNNILDGKWKNDPGVSSLPMFVQSDYAYDKATGAGEITYLNYFSTDAWKIQPKNFDWDYGFMSGGEANTAVYRNKEDDKGNIWCDPAGYYLVTVNTLKNTCVIEAQDITPKVYDQICMAGSFNDWGDTDMTPANKEGENHVWVYTMTVKKDKIEEVKFKIAGSWDTSWGYGSANGEVNTCGVAKNDGANIGVKEGTWVICFNDITGEFSMIKK